MQKNLVILFSLTLFFVVYWIGFNVYDDLKSSTVSQDLQTAVEPIDGTFDQTAIHAVLNRQQIAPLYSLQGSPQSSSSALIASPTPVVPVDVTPTGVNP